MAKKVTRRNKKPTLANDLRSSLQEAVRWARGEKVDVVVHTVIPSAAKARKARLTLGVSQREPKAVKRALKDKMAS